MIVIGVSLALRLRRKRQDLEITSTIQTARAERSESCSYDSTLFSGQASVPKLFHSILPSPIPCTLASPGLSVKTT
eukprot:3241290-Rhodomonas_salina.2